MDVAGGLCSCQQKISKQRGNITRTLRVSIKMELLVFVILAILGMCSGQNMKVDVDSLLNSLDEGSLKKPVALNWGIADSSAIIGKMFNYAIPSDAFKGDIISYKVTEAGKDKLPAWLHFQESTRQLKGVPGPSDLGQQYLEVVIGGHHNTQAKDVFSVSVTGESPAEFVMQPPPSDTGRPNTVRCRRDLHETAVTIVLDTDLDQLNALERIQLMENMTKFLPLNLDMLKLLPVGNKPFIDNNALVAGPGDVKTPTKSGALLSWLVGCGEVNKDHMPIIMEVEPRAKDGSMSKALGQSIIGWHVTNTEQQAKLRRRRQAIRATATPGVSPASPTDLPSKKVDVKETDTLMRSVPKMEPSVFTPTKTADIKPTKTVVMPSASPEDHGHDHSHMMTKLPTPETTTKKTMTDGAITPSGHPQPEPEPEPKATEILPTKTYTMTDAPTKLPRPVTEAPPYCPPDDQPRSPFRKNRMPPIYFTAGQFGEFKIHNNLFFDCKDGDTRSLRLNLFEGENELLPNNSWVGLKHKEDGTWVIQGLPMSLNEGTVSYRLTAINGRGTSPAVEDFIISVLTQDGISYEKPTHEIALTLNNDYNTFDFNDRLMLMKKIARLAGDGNPDNIEVLRVAKGSVIYAWTNSSLPRDSCPFTEIKSMAGKFLREDGTVRKTAKNRLAPYKLSGMELAPKGACMNDPNFPTLGVKQPRIPQPEPSKKPNTPVDVEEEPPYQVETTTPEPDVDPGKAAQGDDDEVWITTVVPAVVIVAILLIALLIACILYRKKRKGKMTLEDKNTFVNKGAPVIFPDEYDEKPNESTKPLIMDEEKPPMPPPEYTKAASESSRSSGDNKNDNDLGEELEMNEPDVNSPLYQPPPPVPASGGNKQPRPHVTPAYKNPAPYVPP